MTKKWVKLCIAIPGAIIGFIFILLFILLALRFAHDFDLHFYIGWKDVKIENLCEMKVPITWEMGEKNGLVYFYDTATKNNDVCLIQSEFYGVEMEEIDFEKAEKVVMDKTEDNILGDDFQCKVKNYGGFNTLGIFTGEAILSVDNNLYEVEFIEGTNYEGTIDVLFYSWNDTSYKIIDKISDTIIINEK